MPELILDRDERLSLREHAHHLRPVVLLGAGGLTPPALMEIDRALVAHQLIKVRAPGDDGDERKAMFAQISEHLSAARVQLIGKTLVLYRPGADEPAAAPPPSKPSKAPKNPRKSVRTGATSDARRPASSRAAFAAGPRGAARTRGPKTRSPH